MTQIDGLRLEVLPNGAHFSFHSTTVERAKADATIPTKCTSFLTVYETGLAELDKVFKLSQKNLLTDEIAASDAVRDKAYRAYYACVKALVDFPDEEMAAAAKILFQHLKDYNINLQGQMDKQTGELLNLTADLTEKYAEQVATLNLTKVAEKLKEANDQTAALIKQRDEAEAGRKVGVTKQARAEVDKAYRNLIQVVNALILMEGEENYADFANTQNQLIRRYKQNILGQTSGNKKPDEEEGEPTPEPVKPEITEVYSKVEDPHDPTGITRGKETIMKWVGDFELVNETGDGPGKIIVKDNFSGIEEEVPAEDILSRSNTGCEFIMIRDFAEGEYKIRIETYDGGSLLTLEYGKLIKLV